MIVIKRNNQESIVDISQIREALAWACENSGISSLELESHIDSIYTDKITTSQIQLSLVDIALRMTTVERPEFRIVAARLLIMEMYKEAAHTRNYDTFGYDDYLTFLRTAVEKGLYSKRIFELYTEVELFEAGKLINPAFDLDFDYAGARLMANRYCIKDAGRTFELPQELFMTVALYLASTEKKEDRLVVAGRIYKSIASRRISLATPILINLRRENGNLSSCFITAMDDSLESIFYTVDKVAQISKNGGGVGVIMSRVRGSGSSIKKVPNASGGVVPWIRIVNDTAVAVNQEGKRAGAVTVGLDIWHIDIHDFLELQTENGDQRKKAYDIFPQVVMADLFMRRVEEDREWTLFDPHEVRQKYGIDLAVLWGDKFDEVYATLEADESIVLKKEIRAKDLFKQIMKSQVETGMPYLFFKDTANRLNPNLHDGMIGGGNLCQESFSNFAPTIPETSTVEDGKVVKRGKAGLTHTCNLVSLNLATIESDTELAEMSGLAVRILDNAIELTTTPVPEGNLHNSRYRTIGVGAMGLADWLAKNRILYDKASDAVDELFEKIAFFALQESCLLAKMRGAYPVFEGSQWSQGILFGRDEQWYKNRSRMPNAWLALIRDIKENGIRNGQLLAIAPNTSSALLQGCSPGVLPVYSKFHVDKNANGAIPICPPFVKDSFWYYKESRHIDQRLIVTIVSRIQRWIDQGISMEVVYNLNNGVRARDIYETLITAWRKGCKSVYYTRTIQKNSNVANDKEECVSCAN